jgi:hypothetical protein
MERLGLVSQLEGDLERIISLGMMSRDGLMPSEQTLAEKYRVSRATAREALVRLSVRGLVVQHPGRKARAVAVEQAMTLENLGMALHGAESTHPERIRFLEGFLSLKREVTVELLVACCEHASKEEMDRVEQACFALADVVRWRHQRHEWMEREFELLRANDEHVLRGLAGARESGDALERARAPQSHRTPDELSSEAGQSAPVPWAAGPGANETSSVATRLVTAPAEEGGGAHELSSEVEKLAPPSTEAQGPGALCASQSGCQTSSGKEQPGCALSEPACGAPCHPPGPVALEASLAPDALETPGGIGIEERPGSSAGVSPRPNVLRDPLPRPRNPPRT